MAKNRGRALIPTRRSVQRLFACLSVLATSFASLFVTAPALACGASAGGGGVAVCTLEDIREKARKKWHVGALYGLSATKLVFDGDGFESKERFEQTRQVTVATLEWRATPQFNLQFGAGALVAGNLEHPTLLGPEQSVAMDPGPVAVLGASYLLRRSKGALPFVLINGRLSAAFSGTSATASNASANYQAYDMRAGLSAGWTLWKTLTPYAVARAFGGPISWEIAGEKATGTDLYHYQAGAGLSVLLAYKYDLFIEGVPLGERGLTAGLGVAF